MRRLRHKVNEVSDLLAQENLDMLFLTETLLSAEVGDGELHIDGYSFFRRDRGRQGGGVGIYFREELSVFSAHVPNTPSSVKLELLFVELDLRNVKLLTGCLYRPPSATVEYWDLLEETLEAVLSSKKEHRLFLTGDFNVDILDNAHPQSRNLQYFQPFFNLKKLCGCADAIR